MEGIRLKNLMQTTHSSSPKEVVSKNKVLAVVLAIITGPSIWLYTYNQDKRKFWVGFGIIQFVVAVAVVLAFIVIIRFNNLESPPADIRQFIDAAEPGMIYGILGLVAIALGVAAWTFIDRIAKPAAWYEQYPKAPLSKTLAIIFAVFLVHLSWLYTYEKDKTKFWIGFGINFFASALNNGFDAEIVSLFTGLITIGIWIWVIVDVASKDSAWYANYPGHRANIPTANGTGSSGVVY